MPMPRPSAATLETFRALLDVGPGTVEKKMFGQLAAFVNGNMFMGVFGDTINVRLDAVGRDEALRAGAIQFEPMPGRPMKEYVVLPPEITADGAALRSWAEKAYQHVVEHVTPKAPKEPASRAQRRR